MIEPSDKAKAYCQKLIDTLVKEGYNTDAKIIEEVLKGWNGEDVPMAVMDEKQGEQKSAELAKGEDYGIDGLWHAQRILEKTFGKVDGYETDDGILSHECAISAVKELYEKKPTEWKQENREELSDFENAMMHIGGSFFGENAGLDPNDTDAIKEQAKLLLELAPKIEWNEEDEIKIISIINFLKSPSLCAMDGNKGIIDANIKYLKSIKDKVQSKPQWKPSDEQMEALKNAEGIVGCLTIIGGQLKSLYEDLKKLKG